jgi:alkylation response protein AidB-like acyl-CoA dehydrogenase
MDELVATVARFAQEVVRPAAVRHDADNSYPHEVVRGMRELGLFGLTIPEAYGGSGIGLDLYVRVVAELAKAWASAPGLLNSHLTVAYLVERYGSKGQKHGYLPRMATGEIRGALLLTEPDAGSDLRAIRTTVYEESHGRVLSGQKTLITNGREAGLYAVLARSGDRLDVYLVPRERPGVSVGRDIEKLGFRGVETVEVFFDSVPVAVEDRVGEEGAGLRAILDALELGRLAIAASAVGVGQAALSEAIAYARRRTAFGRPIAEHQAIQTHLAEMHTRLAAAEALTQRAAAAKAVGRADLETAVAKYAASEACLFATLTAMRVFGGYGYLKEYPIERYFRDAPVFVVGEGTNEVLKSVIAQRLLEASP